MADIAMLWAALTLPQAIVIAAATIALALCART